MQTPRHERLRNAIREATAAVDLNQIWLKSRRGTGPRVGDTYVIPSGYDYREPREAHEWCIIGFCLDDEGGVRLVPCDQVTSMVSSCDIYVPPHYPGVAGRVMRCNCSTFFDTKFLDDDFRVGFIGPSFCEAARRILAAMARGQHRSTSIEDDPNYEAVQAEAMTHVYFLDQDFNRI